MLWKSSIGCAELGRGRPFCAPDCWSPWSTLDRRVAKPRNDSMLSKRAAVAASLGPGSWEVRKPPISAIQSIISSIQTFVVHHAPKLCATFTVMSRKLALPTDSMQYRSVRVGTPGKRFGRLRRNMVHLSMMVSAVGLASASQSPLLASASSEL